MACLLLSCSDYRPSFSFFFFFNDTATPEIYPLSLHDALPISRPVRADSRRRGQRPDLVGLAAHLLVRRPLDRKSTRLNSSHGSISYAVFCLKKNQSSDSSLTCQCARLRGTRS